MEISKYYLRPQKKKTKEKTLNKCIKKAQWKNIEKPIKFTEKDIFDTQKKEKDKKKEKKIKKK